MTRSEAIERYRLKKLAADSAWAAVRANRTDFALDVQLRDEANRADADCKEAYALRVKFAPTV